MTADWFTFDSEFLKKVSTRITNEVAGVSRVLYDSESLLFFPPVFTHISFLLSPPLKKRANFFHLSSPTKTVTSKPPGTIEME